MTFYEIEFPLAALSVEGVEAALNEAGASSISFVDRGDEPVLEPKPGEVRLWNDTLVRALFQDPSSGPDADASAAVSDAGAEVSSAGAAGWSAGAAVASADAAISSAGALDAARKLESLAAALGPHITRTARVTAVKNQDWERVWLTGWKSMRFGRRLWVCPTAADPPDDPQAVVVRLDPGLAFGTGTHPTTALCLQILESLPISGRSVIDYGCGSGILGIAALKLGAAHVTAIDLDPQALLATRDNAIRNGVASNIDVQGVETPAVDAAAGDTCDGGGGDDSGGDGGTGVGGGDGGGGGNGNGLQPAFCVMANILAGPLIELAPKLTAACEPGGYLLLSGLLKNQAYAVKAAYAGAFDRVRVVERDDWCCIYARRGA